MRGWEGWYEPSTNHCHRRIARVVTPQPSCAHLLQRSLWRWTLHDFENGGGHFGRVLPSKRGSYRDRAWEWAQPAAAFLGVGYVLVSYIESVSQRYFDGHPILFRYLAQDLEGMVRSWELLMGWYNDTVADELDAYPGNDGPDKTRQLFHLNPGLLKGAAGRERSPRVAYLVDLAKAETLKIMRDSMGAAKLMERHAE